MGLTIHYAGAVADPAARRAILDRLQDAATLHGWQQSRELVHCADGSTVEQVSLDFDEGCETFTVGFNDAGVLTRAYPRHDGAWFTLGPGAFCKTQYSRDFVRTHVAICDLLHAIAPLCTRLDVADEAGYYDKGDRDALAAVHGENDRMLRAFGAALKETLGAGKVVTGYDQADEPKQKPRPGSD